MLDHQSPLGDSERPSTAVHDHFLIQWQLNWRLDGLLCKTMSRFWTECFALILLDVLEDSTRADMLTTSLVTLVLSSTYGPASQSSEGKGTVGRRGYKERQRPFISSLIWDSCRVPLGVVAFPCLLPTKYPPVTRWLQSLAPGLLPAPSKPSIQQDGGNTSTSGPQLIIKSPKLQRAQHLHLNGRLPYEALV